MTHSTAMATGSMTLAPVEARLPPLPPPPTDAACAVVDWVVVDWAVVDWVVVLGVVEDVVGWVGWVGLVVPDGEGEGTGELGTGELGTGELGTGELGAGEPGAGSGSVVASPTRYVIVDHSVTGLPCGSTARMSMVYVPGLVNTQSA